eukprot:5758826-Alexandrium_andersonii.AAC.1
MQQAVRAVVGRRSRAKLKTALRQASEAKRKLAEEHQQHHRHLAQMEDEANYQLGLEPKRIELEAEREAREERHPRPPS